MNISDLDGLRNAIEEILAEGKSGSLEEIATRLNTAGWRSRRGMLISRVGLSRVMKRLGMEIPVPAIRDYREADAAIIRLWKRYIRVPGKVAEHLNNYGPWHPEGGVFWNLDSIRRRQVRLGLIRCHICNGNSAEAAEAELKPLLPEERREVGPRSPEARARDIEDMCNLLDALGIKPSKKVGRPKWKHGVEVERPRCRVKHTSSSRRRSRPAPVDAQHDRDAAEAQSRLML